MLASYPSYDLPDGRPRRPRRRLGVASGLEPRARACKRNALLPARTRGWAGLRRAGERSKEAGRVDVEGDPYGGRRSRPQREQSVVAAGEATVRGTPVGGPARGDPVGPGTRETDEERLPREREHRGP